MRAFYSLFFLLALASSSLAVRNYFNRDGLLPESVARAYKRSVEMVDDLVSRAPQTKCQNQGVKLTKVVGDCDPAQSRGFTSSHNCATKKSGSAYYCVLNGDGTCLKKSQMKKANMENGECFI
ncbi:hypothetical protein DAEQUDRAFT_732728 [Daedalea quercina L-15889]|uniref:Secreted protein n=1 Tax=Daedalea quercina L-15889 TaxID=1314783 RepID=A0A165LFH0_9APHY|nr:hypothetical protein DAEQUDRAFT_732728 [Daedalea quercina L-15889]